MSWACAPDSRWARCWGWCGWLRREADKRGYGTKQSLFLADGLDTIWRLKEQYFPDAEGCVEWYHVVEKMWSAGECMYAEACKAAS